MCKQQNMPPMLFALCEVNTIGSFVCIFIQCLGICLFTSNTLLYTHMCVLWMWLFWLYTSWPHWPLDYIQSCWIYMLYTVLWSILSTPVCYILLLIMTNRCAWCIYMMQLGWFTHILSMGVIYHVFYFMKSINVGNMALYINDNHILYYHMGMHCWVMLGCTPEYLVVQGWIRATLIHSTNIEIFGQNVHHFLKLFLGWLGMLILVITQPLFT